MNTMVTETQEGLVDPNAQVEPTQTPEIVAQAPMTQTPPVDAEKVNTEQLLANYDKLQKDLNSMKSSFQRKEAERTNEWKAREADYLKQLEELKVSTMDEDQRKAYEQDSYRRRFQETDARLKEIEQEREVVEAMFKAQSYFLANDVPASALVTDQGYDGLWNSGMDYLMNELKTLKSKPAAAPSATPPAKPEQTAPAVVTANGTPAFGGPSWPDLVKTYGDEETVYRLVETGQLPASIIPVPPQYRK